MSKLLLFVKTLRLPNLLLLVLAQFLVSHYFVVNYKISLFILISAATISIALAGYLLNDVFDLAIDKANNKLKFVQEGNKNWAIVLSASLFLLGNVLAYLSTQLSNTSFLKYYIIASLFLILYAVLFSKLKFFGNFIVAGLIVMAIGLAFYQQKPYESLFTLKNSFIIVFYCGLAFLLNWIREVIKDIEDLEGDQLANRFSLPIIIGISATKWMLSPLLLGCTCLFVFLSYQSFSNLASFGYYICLSISSCFAFVQLILSKEKKDYAALSFTMKLIMFLGILLPVFLFK